MTGSGKTGLGIGLIEEAAIDGIPVLVIDPKGDLSNLLLTFPNLQPSEFAPWVNADEARMQGLTTEAFAEREATRWREGLAEWGQSADRIARLRRRREFAVYTPGSRAARPLSVLRTFEAPAAAIVADPELLAERASAAATSVLTLAGIDVEPLRSREHILLSTLINDAWRQQRSLDLPALIAASAIAADAAHRRARARIVLSGRRSLQAGDGPRIGCWPRPISRSGSKAIRSTSARCSIPRPASRESRCCRLRTSTIASACSSSRWS